MSLGDMSGGQRHLNWARQIESNITVPNITILNAVSENILLKQKKKLATRKKCWKNFENLLAKLTLDLKT